MALGLWPPVDAAAVAVALAEIRAVGATDVALVVGWRLADVTADQLAPGPITPPDAAVAAALAQARSLGLAATVFPIVVLDRTAPGAWRGTLAPRDVDRFWTSYERFIIHYAQLAQAHGAAALVVGSELGSTEHWRERWYHLIGRVRRGFGGRLIYSANWDHVAEVSFWDRLDAVGVTGYFELAATADASVDELTAAWAAPRDRLLALAAAHRLPLWLTEVGYVSRDGATIAPWDYLRGTAVDLEEQRRAYLALARAWSGVALDGLFVWEWSGAGGVTDGGYTPRGKPAACALAGWFGGR
ncbi:MAG: hypothetical protein R3B06_19790 [Kofleriaceae bacterium]